MVICLLPSSQNSNTIHYSINCHPSWEKGGVETKETSTTYSDINFAFSCI